MISLTTGPDGGGVIQAEITGVTMYIPLSDDEGIALREALDGMYPKAVDFLPVLKGGDSYAFAWLVCDSSGSSPPVIGDGREVLCPSYARPSPCLGLGVAVPCP